MIPRHRQMLRTLRLMSGGGSPQQVMITVPTWSRPLRPARPAICVYSPGKRSLRETKNRWNQQNDQHDQS